MILTYYYYTCMTIGYRIFNTVNFFISFYATHLINYLCLFTYDYTHPCLKFLIQPNHSHFYDISIQQNDVIYD